MENKTKWTSFMDMHSGGSSKEEFNHCYIEAPIQIAKVVFYNRFRHNPERITCTCCGEDYSIEEEVSLEQITGYERGCDYAYFKGNKRISDEEGWIPGKGSPKGVTSKYIEESNKKYSFNKYTTLEEYVKRDDVYIIYAKDIKDEEKIEDVPEKGYIWH